MNLLRTAVCGFVMACAATPRTSTKLIAPETVLLERMKEYRAAMEAKNLDQLALLVEPDLLVLEGTYKNQGWEDYRDHHIGPEMAEWQEFRLLEAKILDARISAELGYVTEEAAYRISTVKGPIVLDMTETFLFVRRGGTWRIKQIHMCGKKRGNP